MAFLLIDKGYIKGILFSPHAIIKNENNFPSKIKTYQEHNSCDLPRNCYDTLYITYRFVTIKMWIIFF